MNNQDKEGFLSRWSRRKQTTEDAGEPTDTQQPTSPDEPIAEAPDPIALSNEEVEIADQQATRDLSDEDMPALEVLTEDSDYSGFMSPKVSEALRKQALRQLFKASPFHHRDGLDDYDDDFTTFEPLGDTVTSDMKHMMGVEARRAMEQQTTSRDTTTMMEMTPKQTALATLNQHSPDPTSQVEYQSAGRVLIIGDESALTLAAKLPEPLMAKVVVTVEIEQGRDLTIITSQQQREMSLEGWLGNFKLQLTDAEGETETLIADSVIDLLEQPLNQSQVPPPGYFSSTRQSLEGILEDITPLEGTFAKPKFFAYNSSICAHGSSGLSGCRQCIDACPTDAIISIGETIRVEPQLCQGGGSCATACPTGAITYSFPTIGFQVDQLRRMTKAFRDAGGEAPALLLFAKDTEVKLDLLPEHVLPFSLEELASAGAELWMAALSFGMSQVLLLDDEKTPLSSRQQLRHQISIVNTQLAGLGYPDNAVRLIPPLSDAETDFSEIDAGGSAMPYFPPATQAGMDNKRQQWLLAIDHFFKYAPAPQDQIPLPAGSPFGVLKVDKEACTLCMACATVCPAKALSGGTDAPLLKFHPANCVQCGLCETGCPENAIQLEPLLISNRELRNRTQQLNEEKPFHCIDCGKPFASESMIVNMLSKLQGHYMFQDERAKNRLKKCEDCRVVDIVQDDEAMGQPGINDPQSETNRH